MEIVVVGAGPERNDMLKRPWEIITRVRVDGLEKPQSNPHIDGDNMEVGSEIAVEEGSTDGTGAKDEDFGRVSVLGGETEGGAVFVVHLVDVSVERSVVQGLMSNVVEGILEDHEKQGLGEDGCEGR